jgi:chemotaxis protein CheX
MTSTSFLEFSKPFVDAAKNIFETMVFSKLEPGKPFLKENNISKGEVSAVLGITGTHNELDFQGMLVISWPYETYFKVASAMLMETFTKYDEEIADVGGEICNMIMGNAKRDLSTLGYKTNMAIPSMIEGKGHSIKYPSGTTTIAIPIASAHGNFFIELCYKES